MAKNIYLIMAVIGTLVPWWFFGGYFAANGFAPMRFIADLFANGAAGGFSVDVLISILVFWVWSFSDARSLQIHNWWWVIPAGFCVGLSLAMPLYFYLREKRKQNL